MGSLDLSKLELQDIDGTVGPSNFFAGAITVTTQSLNSPARVTMLSGLYLDVNGFTNGATLTSTITLSIGAGNLARTFTSTFVKNATNTCWPVVDTEIPLRPVASAFVLQVQSDNAGDVAVTVPFHYMARSVS